MVLGGVMISIGFGKVIGIGKDRFFWHEKAMRPMISMDRRCI